MAMGKFYFRYLSSSESHVCMCLHRVGRIFHTYPNVLHYKNSDRIGIMDVGSSVHFSITWETMFLTL